MINDDHGKNVSTWDGIEDVFRHHFQQVYLSSNPFALDFEKGTQGVASKANSIMNNSLTKSFTKEEVEVALKQKAPLKSLGPNGFNSSFYQSY